MNNNFVIVISSPSGGGKTTLCRMILEKMECIVYSVSATTRPRRHNEKDGKNYEFMEEDEFRKKKDEGYFAETANVHGHLYGTPKKNIDNAMQSGCDVLMDLDVKGALSIMELYSDAVTVFVLPPSLDELKKRLIDRKTDSMDVIEKRLNNAREEIHQAYRFKYRVVNDNIDDAYRKIEELINKERARRNR
ncbi:MAG: guanylate kinase [bacterium]